MSLRGSQMDLRPPGTTTSRKQMIFTLVKCILLVIAVVNFLGVVVDIVFTVSEFAVKSHHSPHPKHHGGEPFLPIGNGTDINGTSIVTTTEAPYDNDTILFPGEEWMEDEFSESTLEVATLVAFIIGLTIAWLDVYGIYTENFIIVCIMFSLYTLIATIMVFFGHPLVALFLVMITTLYGTYAYRIREKSKEITPDVMMSNVEPVNGFQFQRMV